MEWPKISELAEKIKDGKHSVADLVQEALDRIEDTADYNAVLETNPAALQRAEAIDEQIKNGDREGKLLGVPFIAKDNFLTFNTKTTAASNILKDFKAPYQATAIERLEAEGAILLGKANLDAFAHGSSTENSDFGPTKNPQNPRYVPGGSSGGSAAAVALETAAFALGTDTGGSIRLPASFCGVVGLKPTYGLVSRSGVVAMGSSTDVIGPLTRNVEDAALVLDVMSGKDPLDSTTIERDGQSYETAKGNVDGLKVGVIKEHMEGDLDPQVKELVQAKIEALEKTGAEIVEVSIPSTEQALATYYILVPAEISSNLSRYDGVKYGHRSEHAKNLLDTYLNSRGEGFNVENKRRIMIGTYVLSSGYYDDYYKQAQKVRTLLRAEFDKAFENVDILVGPTSPTPPFKLGAKQEPLSMYLSDVMTVATNLVGIPAISVPGGDVDGLPVGVQLQAPQKGERTLLIAAKALEEAV